VPGGAGRRVWRRDIEKPARAPGGQSAFIHVDPKSGAVELLDFIHATPRAHRPGSGFILHFSKDRPFHGQTAVSVFFEGSERWLLAEALSYDVYRRAGNAAPLTEFVGLSVNGARLGFYLMVERPNKSFLRRNGLDTGGNLYKVGWVGRGLIGTHTKKTNVLTGTSRPRGDRCAAPGDEQRPGRAVAADPEGIRRRPSRDTLRGQRGPLALGRLLQ
jgi:hypothetical protein